MSSSTLEPRGMLGNAVTGYELAWVHRRQLLAVLLPILAPLLIVSFAMDFAVAGGDSSIIDGGWVFAAPAGPHSWIGLGLFISCWMLALTAGTVVVAGGLRSIAVSPGKALLAAGRLFPLLALGVCGVWGVALVVVGLSASAASGFNAPIGIALVLAALAFVAVVAARVLFAVPARLLGGPAWELTRGRVWATAGAFLLGGIVVPVLLGAFLDGLRVPRLRPIVHDIIDAIVLVAVIAVQSGILAYAFLQRRDAASAERWRSADLDGVDARLEAMAGRPWRWQWAAAALVVAALLPAGVAAANPPGAPVMWSGVGGGPPGGPMALAWPSGQHPIIVSNVGVRFCDDDLCDRYVIRNGGPAAMEGFGMANVAADGTVVKATLTGGQDNGGPFIHYGRCTRQDGCNEAWLPVRASAEEPFVWSELAASAAPDGALWFALAVPPTFEEQDRRRVELKLIRCADVKCSQPQRFSLGSVPGRLDPNTRVQGEGTLSIGPDGRPTAAFRIGHTAHVGTCDPITCANPRVTALSDAGPQRSPWAVSGGDAVSLNMGALQIGERNVRLVHTDFDKRAGAVAVAGSEIYAITAVKADQPSGVRLTVGQRSQYWRLVLWHCPSHECDRIRRIPMDVFEGPPSRVMLTVAADGRVLIVREGRVTVIPTLQS